MKEEIAFIDIVRVVSETVRQLDHYSGQSPRDVADVSAVEQDARSKAHEIALAL